MIQQTGTWDASRALPNFSRTSFPSWDLYHQAPVTLGPFWTSGLKQLEIRIRPSSSSKVPPRSFRASERTQKTNEGKSPLKASGYSGVLKIHRKPYCIPCIMEVDKRPFQKDSLVRFHDRRKDPKPRHLQTGALNLLTSACSRLS